jgi:3-hydroxyisobutyrate dehydrogenase-like beta-hydroxyacid dehydrogenase
MDASGTSHWQIGLVGYGEVGRILAEDLQAQGLVVHAHDLKLDTPSSAQALREHAATHGVRLQPSHAALAATADVIVSAVTASQTLAAAEACATTIKRGAFFLDVNSSSPGAKRRVAECINAAGGRYVEGAVMTSVPTYRSRVPLLLGGPDAQALLPLINAIGFAAKVTSHELGVAAATKLCRSVMIKGLEAMVIESLTSARFHGVEDAVIASLQETFPGIDWERQAAYFFQRVIAHGRRRSEEMREAGATVREAGLSAWSADGTAERQAWVADLADAGVFGARDSGQFANSSDWRLEADRVLGASRCDALADR